jgi:hypothetical protein
MVNFKQLIIFIVVTILTIFLSLKAKNWYNNRNYSKILFEKTEISMDTIITQKQAEIFFNYKNIGNKSLKIFRIETSCGCTIPTFNTKLILPNKEDRFKVRYERVNKGFFTKELMVYSNSITSPDRLVISGFVPFD